MQINRISIFKNNIQNEQQKAKDVSFGFYWSRGFPLLRYVSASRSKICVRNKSQEYRNIWSRIIKQFERDCKRKIHYDIIRAVKNHLCESIQIRHVHDVQRVFDFLGIRTQKIDSNKLIIEKFKQPDAEFTFKEVGIDENKIFQFVERIHGNADFSRSNVNNLGNLKSIGGDVLLKNSQLTPDNFKNIKVSGEIKE